MTYVEYTPGDSTPQDIFLGTLVLVLAIIDVLGNTLVVLVIVKDRAMRTPINYLLLNLAIADIMVGAFSIPSTALNKTFTHPTGLTGDFLCKFLTGMSLAWTAEMASAFSLAFIAVERYYAVMHPLNFQRKLTITKIKILVSVCWILSIFLSIPEFLTTSFNDHLFACEMKWESNWQPKTYAVVWCAIGGFLPAVIMVVLYSKVIRSLWFQREEPAPNFTRQAVIKTRKKISQMMLTVSVIYAFTCLPSHFLFIFENFLGWKAPSLGQKILKCLVVFNSSVNPFVYSLQSEQFNKSVKRLFGCIRSTRPAMLGRENEMPRSEPEDRNNLQLVSFTSREIK